MAWVTDRIQVLDLNLPFVRIDLSFGVEGSGQIDWDQGFGLLRCWVNQRVMMIDLKVVGGQREMHLVMLVRLLRMDSLLQLQIHLLLDSVQILC